MGSFLPQASLEAADLPASWGDPEVCPMVVELAASRLVGWEASPPVVWAPPWEEEKAWAREVASMAPPWVASVVLPWAAWVALPSVAWAVFPLA